ncbi:hypothetical protein [Streptomyces sp. AA1529]|uniref:hypothetical protein n=1 Tax=Streptomyces sp. AA1529 TaxID=1203257 RepID=UPI003D748E66
MQAALALCYLLCVAASLAVLAVALRRRQAPPQPPATGPTHLDPADERYVRAILTAAAQLAARISTAP